MALLQRLVGQTRYRPATAVKSSLGSLDRPCALEPGWRRVARVMSSASPLHNMFRTCFWTILDDFTAILELWSGSGAMLDFWSDSGAISDDYHDDYGLVVVRGRKTPKFLVY